MLKSLINFKNYINAIQCNGSVIKIFEKVNFFFRINNIYFLNLQNYITLNLCEKKSFFLELNDSFFEYYKNILFKDSGLKFESLDLNLKTIDLILFKMRLNFNNRYVLFNKYQLKKKSTLLKKKQIISTSFLKEDLIIKEIEYLLKIKNESMVLKKIEDIKTNEHLNNTKKYNIIKKIEGMFSSDQNIIKKTLLLKEILVLDEHDYMLKESYVTKNISYVFCYFYISLFRNQLCFLLTKSYKTKELYSLHNKLHRYFFFIYSISLSSSYVLNNNKAIIKIITSIKKNIFENIFFNF